MIERRTELKIEAELDKTTVINLVDQWRFDLGFFAEEINTEKPWGAYWRISGSQISQFLDVFFSEIKDTLERDRADLSPKFLLVAPGERLSWQYHERRAEIWKVIAGEVSVKLSRIEDEPKYGYKFVAGDMIQIDQGEKHRLIGKFGWGLVAEIWVHTDNNYPSDEQDIIRISDNYGRENSIRGENHVN